MLRVVSATSAACLIGLVGLLTTGGCSTTRADENSTQSECRYGHFKGICRLTDAHPEPAEAGNADVVASFNVTNLKRRTFDEVFRVPAEHVDDFVAALRASPVGCSGEELTSGPPSCTLKARGTIDSFKQYAVARP